MADEIHGNLYFQLKLAGREGKGLFTEVSGGGSENAVIEQKVNTADGHVKILKTAGNLKFTDIVLKGGIADKLDLWNWRKQVIDGKLNDARCDGTLMMLDSEMKVLASYSFTGGWPSKYVPAGLNASQDQAAVEELTLTVETYQRV